MTNEKMEKLLKGILAALALEKKERKEQTKVLSTGGLTKLEIVEILGIAPSTLRVRKLRSKKKNGK